MTVNTRAGAVILAGGKCAILPKSNTLLVGDLHFEKGSFLQMNGHAPLPAYDTVETLARLEAVIARHRPNHVAVLGDSFHDEAAGERLAPAHHRRLNALAASVPRFTWILGNHDPSIPKGLIGAQEDHLSIDGFLLTHLPYLPPGNAVNICGHLHPKVRFTIKRRRFTHPCFAAGDDRIILPSFGAYTGGLYVDDPAIADILSGAPRFYPATGDAVFAMR